MPSHPSVDSPLTPSPQASPLHSLGDPHSQMCWSPPTPVSRAQGTPRHTHPCTGPVGGKTDVLTAWSFSLWLPWQASPGPDSAPESLWIPRILVSPALCPSPILQGISEGPPPSQIPASAGSVLPGGRKPSGRASPAAARSSGPGRSRSRIGSWPSHAWPSPCP